MTRSARLNAWRVVVAATLLANACYAARGFTSAFLFSTAAILAMLALLVTTPPHAILLPRARSEQIITVGTAAAVTIAAFNSNDQRAASGVVLGLILTIPLLCLVVRATRLSAWWVALAAWNPLVLLAIRG